MFYAALVISVVFAGLGMFLMVDKTAPNMTKELFDLQIRVNGQNHAKGTVALYIATALFIAALFVK